MRCSRMSDAPGPKGRPSGPQIARSRPVARFRLASDAELLESIRAALKMGAPQKKRPEQGGGVTPCRERTPDCLILDLNLPGMTGLELQQQLATDHCRIPIVVVSAHDDAASRRQALQSGTFAF
jgi:DNA-binding NarL/FixJ family response regulator